MLIWILEDGLVIKERFYFFDDYGRKIGVFFVYLADSYHDLANFVEGVLGGELLGLEEIIFSDIEIMLSSCRCV